MNPDDFILRNDNIRNNCSPLPSVSGVTRHGAHYSRIEVSRVPVFPLHLIPGSGAEVQKTLAIRKSSKDVNPRPGHRQQIRSQGRIFHLVQTEIRETRQSRYGRTFSTSARPDYLLCQIRSGCIIEAMRGFVKC